MNNAARAPKPQSPIPFIDLGAQRAHIGDAMDKAVMAAVNEGSYILGPQVKELEKQLCTWTGAKHTIACANGTDALALVLMARGVRPGDAIFVPAFTFLLILIGGSVFALLVRFAHFDLLGFGNNEGLIFDVKSTSK